LPELAHHPGGRQAVVDHDENSGNPVVLPASRLSLYATDRCSFLGAGQVPLAVVVGAIGIAVLNAALKRLLSRPEVRSAWRLWSGEPLCFSLTRFLSGLLLYPSPNSGTDCNEMFDFA